MQTKPLKLNKRKQKSVERMTIVVVSDCGYSGCLELVSQVTLGDRLEFCVSEC